MRNFQFYFDFATSFGYKKNAFRLLPGIVLIVAYPISNTAKISHAKKVDIFWMLFSASWLYEELKCHHWQMLHFWPPKGSVYRSAFNEHSYSREQTRVAHKSIHERNPFWQKWMNFCQHPVFSPELTRLSRQISLALFIFNLVKFCPAFTILTKQKKSLPYLNSSW